MNLTIKFGLSIEKDNGSRFVWNNFIHIPPRRKQKSLSTRLSELWQQVVSGLLPLAYLPG